jgi:hypothetical protein
MSRYWPNLNGLADESSLLAAPWGVKSRPQTERENILLDIIGAYDLLLLQGLTEEHVLKRLGLRKSRDELVRELDGETGQRLALEPVSLPPTRLPRERPL